MEYKYHVQQAAENIARSIFPTPDNYAVRNGLPKDYPIHFARLRVLMKSIFEDMVKEPEAYGLKLVASESEDKDLIRKGNNSIHRLFDTLYCLAVSGEVENHCLVVCADKFKAAIKKPQSVGSSAISKYELIFSRLVDFGFTINKDTRRFIVEYPDYPEMIGTLKQFYDCWIELSANRAGIKMWPTEYHHRAYVFDYKVTANLEKITVKQWLADEAKYYGTSDADNDFLTAFYDYSLRYDTVTFDGNYAIKSKRIVRDLRRGGLVANGNAALQLYLRNMEKYMPEINTMPNAVKNIFARDYCKDCNETCKYRFSWTYENKTHRGCGHQCFEINELQTALIPHYWRLLELEYGL